LAAYNIAKDKPNNVAERYGRELIVIRSCLCAAMEANLFCDGLTITETIKARSVNLFEEIKDRFNRRAGSI
jgi:hypothetical protein